MDLADTVVGGATGPGLSGGQKRRLVVALQLLKLPSVIFLDEPTSGLDSASSTELLTHLNSLAASNRTVVLTIHQPRLEIFHMFHRIVVLTDGKVAYHGVPEKAYEVFVDALQSAFLSQGVKIPLLEDHNPADIIMDMLGDRKMRKIVNGYYEDSGEPKLVRNAVDEAWRKEQMFNAEIIETDAQNTLAAKFKTLRVIVQGSRHAGRTHNYSVVRLAALEARAMKRANLTTILYLPVIFFGYGFLLGTVYFQTTEPFLIMSGFCVYSVASALFMFPAMYTFFTQAMELYKFEHADGAGRATDLVIQPFVRFISMAFFPVIICAGVLYVLAVDRARWNGREFLQLALVNLALNQTWTSLLIWLILTFPVKAFRLSPVLSALAGFTSGFFVPINKIPLWYRWMSFINPNYYGFSASAVILLSDFESDCERDGGSELECYTTSGKYILDSFDFTDINPYANIVMLVSMTVFCLLLAVASNWLRFSDSKVLSNFKIVLGQTLQNSDQTDLPEFYRSLDSDDENSDDEEATENGHCVDTKPEEEPAHDTQPERHAVYELPLYLTGNGEITSSGTQLRSESKRKSIKAKRDHRRALYLDEGQAHTVWKPKRFARKVHVAVGMSTAMLEMEKHRQDLHERQQKLVSRVQATREVLKVQREELANLEEDVADVEDWGIGGPGGGRRADKRRWRSVITRVNDDMKQRERHNRKKRSMYFHDTVSQYVAAMTKYSPQGETGALVTSDAHKKRAPSSHSLKVTPLRTGVVPLRQWRSLLFEDHHRITEKTIEPNHDNYEERRLTRNCNGASSDFNVNRPTSSEGDLPGEKKVSLSKQLSLGPDIP
jgi:hypothetical protein